MDKEEFGKKSISRNPLLFSLFKSADLVEKVGSGIGRMREAMRNAKLPAPEFLFTSFFTVTFKRPAAPQAKLTEHEGKKTKGLVDGLVESQIKIIELISNNPRISKREMSEKIGISTTAIDKHIKKLKEKGILKRIGNDKSGHWEIVKK